MIRQFKRYIEEESWDEWLLAQEPALNRICWAIMILAAIYFVPAILKAVLS